MFKLYTGYACQRCKDVKDFFTINGVEFEEINAHEDDEALDFLVSQGLRGVPQIFKDGELVGDQNNYKELV